MLIKNKNFKTIWYDQISDNVQIIDQTKLPFYLEVVSLQNLNDVLTAIKDMKVRGAPLIGATAAFGIYLACKEDNSIERINEAAIKIKKTRPTAVNLFWAVDRMVSKLNSNKTIKYNKDVLLEEAKKICKEDIEKCKKIGQNGLSLIKKVASKKSEVNILTHCNAGWLATVDWGTATAPIYYARDNNINVHVWVDETRPRNQGAALTSYELNNEGIKNTIITDNSAGLLMQRGKIDLCIVGADRVTKNGHVANKIGTFLKAVIAKEFNVPFYVAIPTNTIDWKISDYKDIIIEERDPYELSKLKGLDENNNLKTINIYPKGSKIYNPSFDITPNKFVDAFITEKGIVKASSDEIMKLNNE